MPQGKGTYGSKVGRPPKKKKVSESSRNFHPYNRGTANKKKAKK